jgi:hypothetical protein
LSFLKNELFLSKAERDYLTANSEISGDYSRVIKSRLQKKLEVFVNQELPILVEKGYLDITEFRNVTENCNALVAQPGRELPPTYESEHKLMKKESLGGDLDPRPLPPWDLGTSHPKPYQGNALPG